MGEAGGILAEFKKEQREQQAYPAYRNKMKEEIGDFLWYLVRLSDVTSPSLLDSHSLDESGPCDGSDLLSLALHLGSSVGDLIQRLDHAQDRSDVLVVLWRTIAQLAAVGGMSLEDVAELNTRKTKSRWPETKCPHALFDDDLCVYEQLPRTLEIEFVGIVQGDRKATLLRCNGLNFGDRLTDNIRDPDFYRFHDVFHLAHATYLGWSPVIRALVRCKRKSDPRADEAEDGARAIIIEEAVSAIVYARAKRLCFFDGLDRVDFDLLKMISEFVDGYEVASIPHWQWEEAILAGYSVFRKLRANQGGRVTINLEQRSMVYSAP